MSLSGIPKYKGKGAGSHLENSPAAIQLFSVALETTFTNDLQHTQHMISALHSSAFPLVLLEFNWDGTDGWKGKHGFCMAFCIYGQCIEILHVEKLVGQMETTRKKARKSAD